MDGEVIRHALEVARRHGFEEVEIQSGDARFHATLSKSAAATPKEIVEPVVEPEMNNGVFEIKAPLVGFYKVGEPGLSPGLAVDAGDVVGVITALGLANDVESPKKGEVVEVYVSDGDPVEFGQRIAKLKVTT